MNALLDHLTQTGKAFNISHGVVGTDQFNNFMDDASVLAQSTLGANILLDAIRQFQDWSGMRVNMSKTGLAYPRSLRPRVTLAFQFKTLTWPT